MRQGRVFTWVLLAGLLISCSAPQPLDTAGNRTPVDQARLDPGDEGGIGGTGLLARGIGGTGIIGEVTGFGSIFVNGEEVELDARTQLFLDGAAVSAHKFARGDVVAIRAVMRQRQTVAVEIHIRHEVIGPVQQVLPDSRRLIVLGQMVDAGSQPLPQPGQFVRISGFRDDQGTIHASRITLAVAGQLLLAGEVQRDANGWYIGRQQLRLPATARLHEGQPVRIRGSLQNSVMRVTRLHVLAALPFRQPVSRLLLQGFVQHIGGAQYRIADQVFMVTAQALQQQLSQQAGQPLRLELRYAADRRGTKRWQMSRLLVSRLLPMGRPLPTRNTGAPSPQRPDRPMIPPRPPSMPGRFMR